MSDSHDSIQGLDPKDFSGLPDDATALDRLVFRIGSWISWVFFAAVAITVYEVLMRYAFDSPTEWVHETTIFLVGIGFTYSCAYALARGTHIRITVVYELLPPKWRHVLDLVNGVLLIVYFSFATFAAYLLAKPAVVGYESSGSAWDPHFSPYDKSFLVVMMVVFGFQVLFQTLRILFRRR